MRNIRPQDIDVVILCGGLGIRLQGIVDDRPKPMAEINGRPFLDILIEHVSSYGFTRFILCTGYKGDFIKRYYENKEGGLSFIISHEKKPSGTAGAIKNAESLIESEIFLGLNGDSFCKINIKNFLKFHIEKRAFVSVALAVMEAPKDFGVIILDENQKIVNFNEKINLCGKNFINAGLYIFDRKLLEQIPSDEKVSLEYDLFPRILDKGVYGYVTKNDLLDIGTPERLKKARDSLG